MTTSLKYPTTFDIDAEADLAWQREQRALKSIEPAEVLTRIDELIAMESDPLRHPCYGLVAHVLDISPTPGTSLFERYKQLAQQAIDDLLAERLSNASMWEE